MQRLSALAVLSTLLALTAAFADSSSESCLAESGRACTDSPLQGRKVAEALAAERRDSEEDPRLELLQRAAGGLEKATKAAKAPHAANASGILNHSAVLVQAHEGGSVRERQAGRMNHTAKQIATIRRVIRAFEAAYEKKSNATKRTNYTRGKTCNALTGGMCFLAPCDESRSAECQGGACTCPEYTCENNGKCELSVSEITSAVESGVEGVADKVTSICSIVPGIADTVGSITAALGGISDTISGIVGSLTGTDVGDCSSRFVGTCFWSSCPELLGYTASCNWGSCQCKEGFCATETGSGRTCIVDLAGLMASAFQG
mmetsp:Transcript_24424/g.70053  ORF Transcript_24424/g.70053 Transcript_24424/m.70053 type:complete len:318 (+) Transcript_24424:50-1003(+)